MFPIRLLNMLSRVTNHHTRTNNYLEVDVMHFNHLYDVLIHQYAILSFLQREQSLQEAILVKWEAGKVTQPSEQS